MQAFDIAAAAEAFDPLLLGRTIFLRPFSPDDYVLFFRLEHTAAPLNLSRLGGRTVPIEDYVSSLSNGVQAAHVISSQVTGEPIGYGLLYDVDFASRRGRFAIYTRPDCRNSAASFDGTETFLKYAFSVFPLNEFSLTSTTQTCRNSLLLSMRGSWSARATSRTSSSAMGSSSDYQHSVLHALGFSNHLERRNSATEELAIEVLDSLSRGRMDIDESTIVKDLELDSLATVELLIILGLDDAATARLPDDLTVGDVLAAARARSRISHLPGNK